MCMWCTVTRRFIESRFDEAFSTEIMRLGGAFLIRARPGPFYFIFNLIYSGCLPFAALHFINFFAMRDTIIVIDNEVVL